MKNAPKIVDYNEYEKVSKTECKLTNEFNITNENANIDDEMVHNSKHLDIYFTEFAPKIFKRLRRIENVSEEELFMSLLPSKNTTSISQSQGKSGNFFICTDDNKYVLKTITQEELELIRGLFLKKFLKHSSRYTNSLICRIYGLYKMHLDE